MSGRDITTIQLDRTTHKQLSEYKVSDEETFDDALRRLFRIDGLDR